MDDVNAAAVAAEMVDLKPSGNLASLHHPRYAMGVPRLASKSEATVAFRFANGADPLDAARGGGMALTGEQFLWSTIDGHRGLTSSASRGGSYNCASPYCTSARG